MQVTGSSSMGNRLSSWQVRPRKPSAGFETHWPGNHSSAFSFSHDNPPTSIIPLELLPVEQTLVHDVLELV